MFGDDVQAQTPRGNIDVSDRREVALLLLCVRPQLSADGAERVRLLIGQGIDWQFLLTIAARNGVTPLLYRGLKAICQECVPERILKDLKKRFHDNAVRSLSMTAELLNILKVLERAGVAAIPLKGPALASMAYGDIALREYGDLDILIERRHVERVASLIIREGYVRWQQAAGFEEKAPVHKDIAFISSHSGVLIELHWDISPAYFGTPKGRNGLWRRAEATSVMGTEVMCPSPQDLLAAIAAHGSLHCWERLMWICDLAWLLHATPGTDWAIAVDHQAETGKGRCCLLGLALAQELLGSPLPESLSVLIGRDKVVQRLVRLVRGKLFDEAIPTRAAQCAFHLQVLDGLRAKMLYGLGLLYRVCTPNSDDANAFALPAPFRTLYYPMRLARLGNVLLKRVFRIGQCSGAE